MLHPNQNGVHQKSLVAQASANLLSADKKADAKVRGQEGEHVTALGRTEKDVAQFLLTQKIQEMRLSYYAEPKPEDSRD